MRILKFKEGTLEDFFEQTQLLTQEGVFKPTAALWDAEEAGDISITTDKKGREVIKDLGRLTDIIEGASEELRSAILRIVDRYYRDGRCINKNQIEGYLFTGSTATDPKLHEYLVALESLVLDRTLHREVLHIPADKGFKRPERKFVLFMRAEHRGEGLQDKFKSAWLSNFEHKNK